MDDGEVVARDDDAEDAELAERRFLRRDLRGLSAEEEAALMAAEAEREAEMLAIQARQTAIPVAAARRGSEASLEEVFRESDRIANYILGYEEEEAA